MDIGYFLRERIRFIRHFFLAASFPFEDTKRKILASEKPFVPVHREDGDLPYIEEWIDADDSLQVLGYSCISMLSASFHLYFKTWESELSSPIPSSLKMEFKKIGWFNGYKKYFSNNFGIVFENSPSDLSILEEIVLIRNRIQHPEDVVTPLVSYSQDDLEKLAHKFFIHETERNLLSGRDSEMAPLFLPSIRVTKERLTKAFEEVEKFIDWLEDEINSHHNL